MGAEQRRVLNCGAADRPARHPLVRPCELRWGELEHTGEDRVRYCGTCDHLVHKVVNVVEARVRARQGECLAVPPEVYARVHDRDRELGPQGLAIGFFDECAFVDDALQD